MKVGCVVMARISASTISTLSVPMPVETAEMRRPWKRPVIEANSRWRWRISMSVSRCGDALDAILVAGEEDVLGQLAWSERDVVLPFGVGKRDAGVGVVQAWVRPAPHLVVVRQGRSSVRCAERGRAAARRIVSRSGSVKPPSVARAWRRAALAPARAQGEEQVFCSAPAAGRTVLRSVGPVRASDQVVDHAPFAGSEGDSAVGDSSSTRRSVA